MPDEYLKIWKEEVRKLRENGRIICPLMIANPGLHGSAVCACDIEASRARYLENHDHCNQEGQCLPRLVANHDTSADLARYYIKRHN